MDWIDLTAFRTDAFIGVLPEEAQAPQPLDIEVGMGLDLQGAGDSDDLAGTIDYARVCEEVTFLAQAGHWRLLESLGLAILRHLLSRPAVGEARAAAERVRVTLRKPAILQGRAIPGVVMERGVEWCEPAQRMPAPGIGAAVLCETRNVGAYRVGLMPGATWDIGRPLEVRVLAGAVSTSSATMAAGEQGQWTGDHPLEAGESGATLLVVADPPLK